MYPPELTNRRNVPMGRHPQSLRQPPYDKSHQYDGAAWFPMFSGCQVLLVLFPLGTVSKLMHLAQDVDVECMRQSGSRIDASHITASYIVHGGSGGSLVSVALVLDFALVLEFGTGDRTEGNIPKELTGCSFGAVR